MTEPQADVAQPALPKSTKLLCAGYAAIALVALIATWSQNVAYFDSLSGFADFWVDTKVNPASRSITVDIALFFLAAAVFMVFEARKHGIRFVWVYIVGGALIAISVTFPLFLIARELRVHRTGPPALRTGDQIALAAFAVFVVVFTLWVDVL